ncbi:copper resistance protein B [Alteraurantiacibacter palmitatis]|uniref:Copper resistance protein B n=1 Tax=Alteraurantiacibacter palmitatis TaxID=2054628 RepID=A0ABV7E6I4_9SPHN
MSVRFIALATVAALAHTPAAFAQAHHGQHGTPTPEQSGQSTQDPHAEHRAPSRAEPQTRPAEPADPHAGHGVTGSSSPPPAQDHERAATGQDADPHAAHGAQASPPQATDPHAGHDAAPASDPHAGHGEAGASPSHGIAGTALPAGDAPPPPVPEDFYADRSFSPSEMARVRAGERREHGGGIYSQVLLNLLEYRATGDGGSYHWDMQAWIGGDINQLTIKSEGEGAFRGGTDRADLQLLYSRAIDPYWNFQAGVRYDFKRSRSYAAVGIEGLAPYWFELEGTLFLSDRGDLLARFEGYHDVRLTQRVLLQPRAEANFSAQDVPRDRIGSGLTNIELGLRLRYEIVREFSPYVGIAWERRFGGTARYARADGEDVGGATFVAGVRLWF